jgi:hypothetical protein
MFRKMFDILRQLGFGEIDPAAVDYLIHHHYTAGRAALPLLPAPRPPAPGPQLRPLQPPALELETRVLDFAAMNYFTVM